MTALTAALIEAGLAALAALGFARLAGSTGRRELGNWWRGCALLAAAGALAVAAALMTMPRLAAVAAALELLAVLIVVRGAWLHRHARRLPAPVAAALTLLALALGLVLVARPEWSPLAGLVAGPGLLLGLMLPMLVGPELLRPQLLELGGGAAGLGLALGAATSAAGSVDLGLACTTLGWGWLVLALVGETAVVHAEEGVRLSSRLGLAQERLRRLTDDDPVTSLATRRLLRPELERLRGTQTALLLLRIEDLAAINRRWGLEAGDACLRSLAFAATQAFRADDGLFRFDGDSVLAVAPTLDEQLARARVVHIKKLLDQHEPPMRLEARLTLMAEDEVPGRALARVTGR